jgi:anti-sigma factor ChrR (cupin superfamily)
VAALEAQHVAEMWAHRVCPGVSAAFRHSGERSTSETRFRAIIERQQEEALMTATTPYLKDADKLGPLASRYVEVEALPWKPTPCPGIDMKILLEDTKTGLMTALFRWQPGAELALHEHVEIEQTFVLEGSLVDDEGEVRAGDYVWRPKGNRHVARSPNGALVLSMFLKPNKFLAGDAAGQDLR